MPKSVNTCVCCQCGRTLSDSRFYKSYSSLYINGHLPICKDCFNQDVKIKMEDPDYKSSKKAMQRMCMAFDIYFDEDIFDGCDVEDNIYTVVGNYMKRLNIVQCQGKTYEDTIKSGGMLSGDRKVKHKKRVAVVDEYGYEDEEAKVKPKDIERWGAGFEPEDYEELNSHYKYLKTANPNCDSNQEIFITDLCYIKMQQMKAVRNGEVDNFNKLTESYRKSFTQAGLQVVKDTNTKEDLTLGEMAEMIEKYTPAEYYKDKELYKDFDHIGDYFKRFMLRPLRNLMFGTNERDYEYFVKEEDDDTLEVDGNE